MTKITSEILIAMGFIHRPNLIQESWEYVFEDVKDECPFTKTPFFSYSSISLSVCNDKGMGEYYLFLRQGDTDKRHEDAVVSITRNLLYVEDLQKMLDLLNLNNIKYEHDN